MKILTIAGPSGSGKTTLGQQAARRGAHVQMSSVTNSNIVELLQDANYHRLPLFLDGVEPKDIDELDEVVRETVTDEIPLLVVAGSHLSPFLNSVHIELEVK